MSSDADGPRTRLQQTLKRLGIPSARVEAKLRERMGGNAPSRRQMERWRLDKVDIRRKDMVRILWALRVVANDPNIHIEDLFDLDPSNPDNWRDS